MITLGVAPFLECSSRGDKRFSAFCAEVPGLCGLTIEQVYQGAKIFEDGRTGLTWREAKGKRAINQDYCNGLYSYLWDKYILHNEHLIPVLTAASGLSDMFGQPGHVCQAVELWRIRSYYL